MSDTMNSLLVTGGCGFVGSNFVRFALERDPHIRITVLDKLTYAANRHNLDGLPPGRVALVVGDICDEELVESLVADHEAVVNFAAESHNDKSIADPEPFIHTNISGTYRLLEACRHHERRFHHVSTDEVYGDLALDDSMRFTEESPVKPSSPYSASKASSDLLACAWFRTFGVRVTISNSSNNYGPYQHIEKFIPRQITNILTGRRAKLYGDGRNVRDWIHVDDHSAAVWQILCRGIPGETYLISAEEERSNCDVLRSILRLMGRDEDDFDWVGDRPGHDRRYALDASKLRRDLGWEPEKRDFEAGLAEVIAWYRSHESWWRDGKDVIEDQYARWGH